MRKIRKSRYLETKKICKQRKFATKKFCELEIFAKVFANEGNLQKYVSTRKKNLQKGNLRKKFVKMPVCEERKLTRRQFANAGLHLQKKRFA